MASPPRHRASHHNPSVPFPPNPPRNRQMPPLLARLVHRQFVPVHSALQPRSMSRMHSPQHRPRRLRHPVPQRSGPGAEYWCCGTCRAIMPVLVDRTDMIADDEADGTRLRAPAYGARHQLAGYVVGGRGGWLVCCVACATGGGPRGSE
ncbi:predicted protein [Plenodomus lingam JN3]|uniref:Predicted protein n=1 Tax=Leptosphaeria maculans (strain JN3 / isolate v23.1.3 / race Av1-4-5-6-7-8) TaxID=985895 RepID=E4ZNN6_LEPMJ|nr:predicted protein [Plenodomus lingam JN3]CBX93255.1 predicted protein [Plenodomus lingam JN3]